MSLILALSQEPQKSWSRIPAAPTTASPSPPSPPAVAADTCSASSTSPLPGIFGLLRPPVRGTLHPPRAPGPGSAAPPSPALPPGRAAAAAALAFSQLGSPLSYFLAGRNFLLRQQETTTAALRRGDFRDEQFPMLWGLIFPGRVVPPGESWLGSGFFQLC